MNVTIWIKYYDKNKVKRHFEYTEKEKYVDFDIEEKKLSDLRLAFIDKSYDGEGKIYYDLSTGKLWRLAKIKDICVDEGTFNSPLNALKWWRKNGSWNFPREFLDGEYPDFNRMFKRATKEIAGFLIVNGKLFIETTIPYYVISTFGWGNNSGGTALFVHRSPKGSVPIFDNEWTFSALDGKAAVSRADEVAEERGDTKDVGKFKTLIEVFMPELKYE